MVMWRDPEILASFNGYYGPYSSLQAINPGISTSAMSISLRPHSANVMSCTLKSSVSIFESNKDI